MRALPDANVYISYLLNRHRATPPVVVMGAAFRQAFNLLVTETVFAEVIERTQRKPYLAERISRSDTYALIADLRQIAEFVTEISPPFPQIGRDRKDDYLFAHALLGEADYLISGDGGVQKVERVGDVRIVSPAGFLDILRESGRLT